MAGTTGDAPALLAGALGLHRLLALGIEGSGQALQLAGQLPGDGGGILTRLPGRLAGATQGLGLFRRDPAFAQRLVDGTWQDLTQRIATGRQWQVGHQVGMVRGQIGDRVGQRRLRSRIAARHALGGGDGGTEPTTSFDALPVKVRDDAIEGLPGCLVHARPGGALADGRQALGKALLLAQIEDALGDGIVQTALDPLDERRGTVVWCGLILLWQ